MAESTPNAALAYAVLDHIDAHPTEWDQSRWVCGSAACFAGWAVRLSGGILDDRIIPKVVRGPEHLVGLDVDDAAYAVLRIDSLTAGEDDEGGGLLFADYNSREDLDRLVAEIFGPRPEATPAVSDG